MIFPKVTGIKFLMRNSLNETEAPAKIPNGIKNMLAMECSNPIDTKLEIGINTPRTLPGRLEAAVALQTAKQTHQLARIPRTKA